MKMNYPLKNNSHGTHGTHGTYGTYGTRGGNGSRGNRYKTPSQIVAVTVCVLIILHFILPNALHTFFTVTFSPLWRLENTIASNEIFATHSALVAENSRLSDEVASLSGADDSVALLEQENAELKAMLGRNVSTTTTATILAAVLKVPPFSGYDSIILDVGSEEHIVVGDKVYAVTSTSISMPASSSPATSTEQVLVPIGSIAEISTNTATVKLYSSPGQNYAVLIGPDHIPANAVAEGGGTFMAELAQGANVKVGDPVTVSAIEPITFGVVGAILNNPTDSYMNVLFKEPVNIYQIRWVEVQHG